MEGKNILLFGSEGFGIKAKTLENSDFRFKVKMNDNIESLNISNIALLFVITFFNQLSNDLYLNCIVFHKFILKKQLSFIAQL